MESICILSETESIGLCGAELAAPVRSARRLPVDRSQPGEGTQLAAYELSLAGQPGELAAWLERLERLLWLAAAGDPVSLRRVEYPGAPAHTTRLQGGRLLAGSVTGGAALARVELAFASTWYAEPVELALNGVTGGVNISAPGWVGIEAGSAPGSRPAALRVEISAPGGGCGRLRLALSAPASVADPDGLLEAEAGSGGSLQSSPASHGGAFRRCAVPATAGDLIAWSLPAGLVQALRGRETCLSARLANPAPAGVWAGWEVRDASGALLAGSARELLPAGAQLIDLPALPIPDAGAPLALHLVGQAAGAGLALDVDFVQLLPLGVTRAFDGLPAGGTLQDDGASGLALRITPDGALPCFATGALLRIDRWHAWRLYLLTDAGPSLSLRVRAWAQAGCGR